MKTKLLAWLLMALPLCTQAQEKWDLRRCVDHAMKNNISVRQADVQARLTALQLQQARLNQYPTANFSTGTGMQFGRSIDPTTNQFTTTQLLYNNMGLSGGVDVFNFGRVKSAISAAGFSARAALADVEKAANDVALNVATYYLQTLASREQINIAQIQVAQTLSRLSFTRARVNAGVLPELNLAQEESQLANDSVSLVTAMTTYQQNLLQLKALLNLDPAAPFEIETPPVDAIPLEPLANLEPEVVYQTAMANFPQQKAAQFRIEAAKHNIKVSRASMYPSLQAGYQLGTNFSNAVRAVDFNSVQVTGYKPSGLITNVNGTNYNVLEPQVQYNQYNRNFFQLWNGYGRQIDQNFRQAVGLTISVPIFNNGNARLGYERSKLDLRNAELVKEQADRQLKQDIYTAYVNATAAMQRYQVSRRTVESAQKAYDFALKRYEVGLLGTLDLIVNQNTLLTAKLQQLNNQYEYVFRMKLLEFYKGQGLKL